ncbi:MAG: aminoacyl-histidine dipeptidase [Alloprevotella sp.]|nr:aminoacyl-histidine dipeptidase [Alloprevotella sp.]
MQLTPESVFSIFAEINKIPRPSGKEEKMTQFLIEFGQKLGLETRRDEVGNVVIKKPATAGMESAPGVILQSHMDMVCEKNATLDFDFDNDAIQTYIDGEWLTANGTTLGADDGIGCAMQMAVLVDDNIKHGPLECVFTVDEERGLTGAEALKPDFMEGDYLINLDSEDEGEIFVSCAGGANTTAKFPFSEEAVPEDAYAFKVSVKGLTGGHSGDDIIKKRANANKLIIRFLCQILEHTEVRLVDIQSGGLHNAIPREGFAVAVISNSERDWLSATFNQYVAAVEKEFEVTEKDLHLELTSVSVPSKAQTFEQTCRFVQALNAVHNGVFSMSQTIENFVETSSNLASIHKTEEGIVVVTSQRSSLMSNRENVSAVVRSAFVLGGATYVKTGEGYPGWETNPNSKLVKIAVETYKSLFDKNPKVLGIHAGLECGLFSVKYPHLDMISIGPTLRGVHSPDEKLLIPTVDLVWRHLLLLLEELGKLVK